MASTNRKSDNKSAYSAIFLALLVFIVRVVGYLAGWPLFDWQTYFVFAHIFFLLVIVLIAVRPLSAVGSFAENAKAGARAASIYAISVTVLAAIYYGLINTGYFDAAQEQIISREIQSNPEAQAEQMKEGVKQFFSLGNYLVITLVGLIVPGMVYSLLMALLVKLFRKAQ